MSVCHTDNTGDPDGEGAAGVKRCAYIGMRRGHIGDVRMLATDAGLMNRGSRLAWKACKMDGRASRFRSEPDRSAHNAAA